MIKHKFTTWWKTKRNWILEYFHNPCFMSKSVGFQRNPSHFPAYLAAECEDSEESSGEVEVEQETSDLEDVRELHPSELLHKSSQARNLPVMAEALAHGADVNSINEENEGKSPLIQAVTGVSQSRLSLSLLLCKPCWVIAVKSSKWLHTSHSSLFFCIIALSSQGSLIASEFLLQNGADVNQKDARGRGPLHHATSLGHTGWAMAWLYIRHLDVPDATVLFSVTNFYN